MVRRHFRGRVRSFSYQSLIPAGAGTPRFENPELRFYAAESHGGFCHAQAQPQRGTSPSPRVVFDRATLFGVRYGPAEESVLVFSQLTMTSGLNSVSWRRSSSSPAEQSVEVLALGEAEDTAGVVDQCWRRR